MGTSPRHTTWLFALLMSCVMAFIMTGFVTWVNTGMDSGYPARWLHAFLLAWPLAMSCILLFSDGIRTLASKLATQ